MGMDLPVIAGALSTIIFVLSTLPMVSKACRTKDLRSYSLGNILLSNGGNVVHSVYVFHLPPGPIWLLHSFYLVTTGLMLVWYLRYEWRPHGSSRLAARRFGGASSAIGRAADQGLGTAGPPSPTCSQRIERIPRCDTPFGEWQRPFTVIRWQWVKRTAD